MANTNKKEILKSSIDKVKLVDAGVKNKYGYNEPVKASSASPENKIYYPSLYLDTKEAPMLSGCDVGCEVTLLIKTHITSHSLNERLENKREDFCLEIREIGVVSTNTKEK